MVDLKYSFERDLLFELFEKKLSGDKLASELALYEQDWVKIGGNAIVTLTHSFDDICGSPPIGGNSHKKKASLNQSFLGAMDIYSRAML